MKKKNHYGCFAAVVVVLLLLLAMAMTNPKEEDHWNTFSDRVTEAIRGERKSLISILTGAFAESALDLVGRQYFEVKDYKLFSLGKMNIDKEKPTTVTVGVFGHVFTADKETMREKLKQAINGDKKEKAEDKEE